MNFEQKYLKYKQKYINIKNQINKDQIGGNKNIAKYKMCKLLSNSDELKIMSFNILADAPIWKKKYEDMKKDKFIFWNYRKKLIIDIISKYQPDICLLCEVEYDKIIFFSKFCNNNNYGYIYTSMEPPKSKKSLEKYKDYTNNKNPGILIMFKLNKLKIINNLAPDYYNYFNDLSKKYNWSDKELQTHLQQCVSNIILFEKLDDESRFYFSGLHHPYVRENVDVQNKQIKFLLEKINILNYNYNFPVLIAGDFNSQPTSKVYQIMNDNNYNSVYKIFNNIENKYTTTNSFTNERFTLDYIFINNKCKVTNVCQVDEQYLEHNNIPNTTFPSDHVFLIANITI
jgi:mRNA deadenylase 3'-5' endonuclease subunit Ccr4